MVESYKIKSKIATAAGAIATIISIVGVTQLQNILPSFSEYIPVIFALATWYLSQSTENKRVQIAEQLIHESYNDPTAENLNPEYVVGESDDQ